MNEEILTQDQYIAQEHTESPQAEKPKVESEKEQNIRYFRERAELAERKAQENERRAQELELLVRQNMNQTGPATRFQGENDPLDIQDDTYIEGRHYKQLRRELQETRERQERFKQESDLQNAERQLRAQFQDFDKVVSADNLRKLAQQKPALYRSIIANPDVYDKGYAAYEIIKSSGMTIDEYEYQDRRMEDNKSKPRSASAQSSGAQVADTPLAGIGNYDRRILTEERKEQLLRQVALAKQMR